MFEQLLYYLKNKIQYLYVPAIKNVDDDYITKTNVMKYRSK